MPDQQQSGIVSWGTYLPTWRLDRSGIAAVLGAPSGRGTRSAASHDEDTTTMAAEAVRTALQPIGAEIAGDLYFATPDPAYLDKTNATAIHAAAGLPRSGGAYDLMGSSRSAVAAVRAAQGTARPGHRTAGSCLGPSDGSPGLFG